MKNLSVYLPDKRLFVGVLIVLAVTTFVLRQLSGNATAMKVKGYLGLV